jgi:hypothetical protein
MTHRFHQLLITSFPSEALLSSTPPWLRPSERAEGHLNCSPLVGPGHLPSEVVFPLCFLVLEKKMATIEEIY